jgi:hypothetical protein
MRLAAERDAHLCLGAGLDQSQLSLLSPLLVMGSRDTSSGEPFAVNG